MKRAAASLVLAVCFAAACGGSATPGGHPQSALASTPAGAIGHIEVKDIPGAPRLTLVSRDGDPVPSIVVAFATDLASGPTTALAALVEGRFRAAGYDVEVRVDRSAFRVGYAAADAAHATAFVGALNVIVRQPVTAGAPELAVVGQRLESLRRNPLDAEALAAPAACTDRLGVVATEPLPDVRSEAGLRDLEAWRRSALTAARGSIGVVGPEPFCSAASDALARTKNWPAGDAARDEWPPNDAVATYASHTIARRAARATIAVRVGDVHAAIAAAERLGAPASPLVSRLLALPQPWRASEVVGVARPRGGCVSVTIEAFEQPAGIPIERAAALAIALVRQEIRAELAAGGGATVASRQILGAADARDAASRAAWWALAGGVRGAPERQAIALGVSANESPPPSPDQLTQRLKTELDRVPAGSPAAVERKIAVERGQGELWVLLASPCGVAEEGVQDAGATALAALAATEARTRDDGVAIEPWITGDGVGLLAHAAPRDGENATALAQRVANAAARTLAATIPNNDALASARATALEQLEQLAGRQASALEAFAGAIVPDHPSWVMPLGTWARVAGAGLESVRLRWQALAAGPLRAAVIANVDEAQAAAALDAVDRWITPAPGDRACHQNPPAPPRPGHYEAHLPGGSPVSVALVGAAIAPGQANVRLADLTAVALDADGGPLAPLASAATAARHAARVLGGTRSAALAVEIQVPTATLPSAVEQVKAALTRFAQGGVGDADLARALALVGRRERAARSDPRRRLIDLWLGRPPKLAPPALSAWRDFLAATFRDGSLVIVEAKPD